MLWYQGAQNKGLSNRKLKSALNCTVWSQCTPVPDRRTDKHHDNSATIVLRFTSCAKVLGSRYRVFQKLDREADKQKHRRTRPKTLPRRTRGLYDTKSRHAVHGIYRSRRNVKITVFTASFIYCDFFIVPIVAASTACALQFSTSITRIQHNCHSLSVRNHNRRPCNSLQRN